MLGKLNHKNLFCLLCIILCLFSNNNSNAKNKGRIGISVNIGFFHSLNREPNRLDDPYYLSKYNLKERTAFSFDIYKSGFFNPYEKKRFGLHLIYLSVKRIANLNSRYFINSVDKDDWFYSMFGTWIILQRKLYDKGRLQIALDISSGLSFISEKGDSWYSNYHDSIYISDLNVKIGFQIGVTYLIKLKQDLGLKLSPNYQLQTGGDQSPSFPFSSGFIILIGFVVQK